MIMCSENSNEIKIFAVHAAYILEVMWCPILLIPLRILRTTGFDFYKG